MGLSPSGSTLGSILTLYVMWQSMPKRSQVYCRCLTYRYCCIVFVDSGLHRRHRCIEFVLHGRHCAQNLRGLGAGTDKHTIMPRDFLRAVRTAKGTRTPATHESVPGQPVEAPRCNMALRSFFCAQKGNVVFPGKA